MLSPQNQHSATFVPSLVGISCCVGKNIGLPTFRTPSLFGVTSSKSTFDSVINKEDTIILQQQQQQKPRIAIIGGGIAGVTAANALGKKFGNDDLHAKIVVFEGDVEGGHKCANFEGREQPTWIAGERDWSNKVYSLV